METRLTMRLDFSGGCRLGPGKIALLESIARHGSIAAAGREFGMGYRRAWLLVADLNRMFVKPLVETKGGGRGGGGATLTDLGKDIVLRYRRIERAASLQGGGDIAHIEQMLAPARTAASAETAATP